jgi:transcriptional regulator with XRE-family HTH domain/KaiC/GvpD/RAD55 family RecA-like ATPase
LKTTTPILSSSASVSTGIPFLDSLLGSLFIGDNVIWYDDAGSLAGVFCLNFMQTSQSLNKDIIYVSFDRSPRNLLDKLGPLADNPRLVIIDCFTFGKGAGSPVFLGFYERDPLPCKCRIVRVANPENAATVMDVFYSVHAGLNEDVRFIFESLTGMQELWEGEDQLLNFYAHSCPRLYELNTVAYWMIERKAHSSRFRAQINQIAQVVIDLSVKRGKTSLTVIKAEKRHVEHIHQPHDYWTRDMQVVFDSEAHVHGRVELGLRLKELRIKRGMSQTDLARQVGVTPSTISQVEGNLIYPSLPALLKMAEILNIPPGQLLQDAVSPAQKIHFTAGDATEIRFADQPRDSLAGWHLTGQRPDAKTQIYLIELHAKARIPRHFLIHKGYETGYLLKGEIQMTVNNIIHSISPGDVICLDKETPSQWKNTGLETARLLWMTTS